MPRPAVLDYTTDNCSLVRAMQVLGERWTLVVLREVFIGVCRFEDIRQHTGIPRQVLTDRLGNLVAAGILVREPYQDPGSRVRHQYRLTPKGLDLQPALIALTRWGDRHLADEAGPPIEFRHRDCDGSVDVVPVCTEGHTLPDPRQTVLGIGPGARPVPDA